MSLSTSPRKVVPLASGDDSPLRIRTKSTGSTVTKRVFFCGVVVENTENGAEIPPDVQDLIASLGEPLDLGLESGSLPYASKSFTDTSSTGTRRRAMTNSSALADIVKELLVTERSYVSRIRMLKNDYADPLRTFARSKDTAILPLYEAKILFGNIDNLLPVNEAFLDDLEKMDTPRGPGVGDVALKHFKTLNGFEHYRQYYSKREEAQTIFEREIKKSSGFSAFVDRIKYSSADTKNRVGLRELLMEPVQRIPRYTLMFRTMIKHMGTGDPQRAKLLEADEIASCIALAETDEQTKRAAIMYCLSASIDDFPPALVSHGRRFVDCIDVEDVPADGAPALATSGGPLPNLHCTLFLFDDKLMVVKRPGGGERSGRALAGLDELERLARAGGLPLGKKKSGMSCKGVVDITDVVATDVGGADIHLYLENPPQDQTDRWAGRPFRSLSVVHPPSPVNLDPTRTEADKKRFLENLWTVQARYRTRAGQSVVLCTDEREVENKGGKITMAKTYFNIYQRNAFLQEPKKTKIVLHIDLLGSADRLPFGMRGPPFVVVRVQPMAGELSRYKVTSSDPTDDDEEDIVQTMRVPDRIVQTTHQFGLFKFRTGKNSVPTTPTASLRGRAAIFGLDAISRNLFNARPGSAMGDLFGGSTNSHRRSRTTTSRASTYTQSTSTGDGSLTRFSRSNSSTATSISLMDDDSSSGSRRTRSLSRAKKLIKRAKSPGGSGSEAEASPRHERMRSAQSLLRRSSAEPESEREDSDWQDEDEMVSHRPGPMDQSERDLTMRLELARRNSQNQHEQHYLQTVEPTEATIYEEDLPNLARPLSRASRELPDLPRDAQSQRSITPRPQSSTPTRALSRDASPRRTRSTSRHSADRRPMGPRTPSPLPPRSPQLFAVDDEPSVDADDSVLETTLVNMTQTPTPVTPTRSFLPRSKRQPFEPTENMDVTPRAASPSKPPGSVEPLSIKKKTSVRTTTSGSPLQRRPASAPRSLPASKVPSRVSSPRKTSGQSRAPRTTANGHTAQYPMLADVEDSEQLLRLAETTKADLESSHRAVKRIKLETGKLRSALPGSSSAGEIERPASPVKGLRSAQQSTPIITREAQERMEEMRQLIGKRYGESTPRSRHQSMLDSPSLSRLSNSPVRVEEIYQSIEDLATRADREILKAITSQDAAHSDILSVAAKLKERSADLESARVELRNTKRQCELVKSLLADCTSEKEIMFEAFNEELDGMFNDASLPEDEAWAAMTRDLRQTKEARNVLSRDNSNLKRRLAEMEMQNDEWGTLLRAHGLIP